MLAEIVQDIDSVDFSPAIENCLAARNLAVNQPSVARNNAENYAVRIISRVS